MYSWMEADCGKDLPANLCNTGRTFFPQVHQDTCHVSSFSVAFPAQHETFKVPFSLGCPYAFIPIFVWQWSAVPACRAACESHAAVSARSCSVTGLSGADPHRCVIADHHKSSSQLLVLVRSAPLAETWDPQGPCGQVGEEDPALLSKSLCSNFCCRAVPGCGNEWCPWFCPALRASAMLWLCSAPTRLWAGLFNQIGREMRWDGEVKPFRKRPMLSVTGGGRCVLLLLVQEGDAE